jgi:putative sterol carrier protein
MSTMAARMKDLLEAIAAQSRERPLPAAISGVVRLDVEDAGRTDHWYLTITKGTVTIARKGGEPDAVLRGDAAIFTSVLSGEANMMAAILRGALEVEGRMLLLVALQRFSPGETADDGAPVAGYARRQS